MNENEATYSMQVAAVCPHVWHASEPEELSDADAAVAEDGDYSCRVTAVVTVADDDEPSVGYRAMIVTVAAADIQMILWGMIHGLVSSAIIFRGYGMYFRDGDSCKTVID